MPSAKELCKLMAVEDDINSPLAKYIGMRCYVKCYNNGNIGSVGVEVDGIKVRVQWISVYEGQEWVDSHSTNIPQVHNVQFIQKDYRGEACLRVMEDGASKHSIGFLVEAEDIVCID